MLPLSEFPFNHLNTKVFSDLSKSVIKIFELNTKKLTYKLSSDRSVMRDGMLPVNEFPVKDLRNEISGECRPKHYSGEVNCT